MRRSSRSGGIGHSGVAALFPISASVRDGAHRARAEAAGDPEWAAEGARVAVRSGQCRTLRVRRPLRPVPAAPRAAASEAESREQKGLSQPALWDGGGGESGGRGPSLLLGLPSANACWEAPPLRPPTNPAQVPSMGGGHSAQVGRAPRRL